MNISNSDLPHKIVPDLLDGKISWLVFVPQITKLLYEELLGRVWISDQWLFTRFLKTVLC